MNKVENNKINILESILWLVVIVSFVSVVTLISGVFKPSLVLIGSLVILVIGMYALGKTLDFNLSKDKIFPTLTLLLLALFFRIDQEQYIMGGQDEGVYVNMSKYFENHGQIFPKDNFRNSLSDELKIIYDKNNIRLETREGIRVDGGKEDLFLPGVYVKDIKNSEYVFQFYHLHPIWMAIFGDTFGEDKRQFSLLFFSLLSIVFFYLIIHKITASSLYSFTGGLLLAVNPLHTYFTKFPVTEVMALSFSLAGFYFLLLYYHHFVDTQEKVNRYLVLSACIFGSMFFLRMHGFMYIPFFYAIFLLVTISNIAIKKELLIYIIAIFAFFTLSVWYGLIYSYPYVTTIYEVSFSRALGDNWGKIISAIIIIITIIPFLLNKFEILKKAGVKIKKVFLRYFYIIFFIILALGIYKVYQLGFTDKYFGDPWLDSKLHISGNFLKAILHSSLTVLIEHVSLILFITFFIGLKHYDRRNHYLNVLVLFVFGFWVYAMLLQWVVPYQYYYSRYFLSELIPYLLLFTVIFMASMKHQKVAKGLLLVSIVYFTALTSLQLKGTESKGAYDSLNHISGLVTKDDVLLVDRVNYPFHFKTTLKYYYDLNVFSIKSDELEKVIELFLQEKKGDIYYLAQEQISINNDYAKNIKRINVSIESTNYDRGNLPFVKYNTNSRFYNIYKIDLKKMFFDKQIASGKIYMKGGFIGTLVNFYGESVWARSSSSIIDLDFPVDEKKILKLSTHGWNPNIDKLDTLKLKLGINEINLKFIKYFDNNYYFELPDDIKVIHNIEISSNTFIPKEMGINNDSRELGIDLKEITLLKDLPQ